MIFFTSKNLSMEEDIKYMYNLKLTENQAKVLSKACDVYSRLICGQEK